MARRFSSEYRLTNASDRKKNVEKASSHSETGTSAATPPASTRSVYMLANTRTSIIGLRFSQPE